MWLLQNKMQFPFKASKVNFPDMVKNTIVKCISPYISHLSHLDCLVANIL